METMGGPTVYLDPPIKDLIPLVTALLALLHGEILQVEFNKFRYLVSNIISTQPKGCNLESEKFLVS